MVFKGFQSFLKLVSCFGIFHVFQRFSVILEIGQLFSADFRRFPCYPVVLEIGQLFLGLLRSLKVDFHVSQRFPIVFFGFLLFFMLAKGFQLFFFSSFSCFSCWSKVFSCFSSFPLVLHVGQRFSDVFFKCSYCFLGVQRFPAVFHYF